MKYFMQVYGTPPQSITSNMLRHSLTHRRCSTRLRVTIILFELPNQSEQCSNLWHHKYSRNYTCTNHIYQSNKETVCIATTTQDKIWNIQISIVLFLRKWGSLLDQKVTSVKNADHFSDFCPFFKSKKKKKVECWIFLIHCVFFNHRFTEWRTPCPCQTATGRANIRIFQSLQAKKNKTIKVTL